MRRVFGRGGERRGANVEMAPLIDMVFILLIFFMVTTSFIRESGVKVDRPQSQFTEKLQSTFLPVGIDAEGGVHVAGQIVPPDSVRGIRDALEAAGQQRVLVQADKRVTTELLLKVLDTCKLAGATQVDVAAVEGR